MNESRSLLRAIATTAALLMAGCTQTRSAGPTPTIRYVGSSTVAIILQSAEPRYAAARFEIDTEPESAGGERAILAGTTDLAGIAHLPRQETLSSGIASVLVGRDAIAVIVNVANPVAGLSLQQLHDVFTGTMTNWRDVGGPDLEIHPLIVGPESATRDVFGGAVLGGEPYAGCREIRPDRDIVSAVASDPGAVGQISFSFLESSEAVRPLAVEQHEPSVTNFDYPISRPLFLLWREGDRTVEAFVDWIRKPAGQRAVMQHFVGVHVIGSVRQEERTSIEQAEEVDGKLIVLTETDSINDGGIQYYPHRPYDILDRHGGFLRRIRNHRGFNDEKPTTVTLAAGTYLIRTETSWSRPVEFFVTIERDKTTTVDVERLLER